MEDDLRAAIVQMHSPMPRNSSKASILEARNSKSNMIWLFRRMILIVLAVLELSKWCGKLLIEYLILEGYFGKNSESVEVKETEDIDLDDTIEAILLRIFIQLFIGAVILPHVIAYFVPQIRVLLNGNSRDV